MKRILFALAALSAACVAPAVAQTPLEFNQRSQPVGRFRFYDTKDPITDENTSAIAVVAERTGFVDELLIWRCESGGEYSVMVDGNTLTAHDTVPVVWRFDAQTPQNNAWKRAGSGYIALMDDRDGFTTTATRAQRVVIRATVGERVQTFTFRLDGGLRAALAKLPCLAEVLPPAAAARP